MSEVSETPTEALEIGLTTSDAVVPTVTFIDMLTAGTFIATALMLILAITTVVKEIQVRKINNRLKEIEKDYSRSIKKLIPPHWSKKFAVHL